MYISSRIYNIPLKLLSSWTGSSVWVEYRRWFGTVHPLVSAPHHIDHENAAFRHHRLVHHFICVLSACSTLVPTSCDSPKVFSGGFCYCVFRKLPRLPSAGLACVLCSHHATRCVCFTPLPSLPNTHTHIHTRACILMFPFETRN